jgi:hypothetical protein
MLPLFSIAKLVSIIPNPSYGITELMVQMVQYSERHHIDIYSDPELLIPRYRTVG